MRVYKSLLLIIMLSILFSIEIYAAPILPSCSLDNTTIASDELEVKIGDYTGLTLQYALIEKGGSPSDKDFKNNKTNIIEISRDGIYSFYYRVLDETTGETATSNAYTIYLDTRKPSTPKIDDEVNKERQCVYVTIEEPKDSGTDIVGLYYRIDGGRWREYDDTIILREDGVYLIETYCIDYCGNKSDIKGEDIEVDYSDMLILPTVEMLDNSPSNKRIRFILYDYSSDFDYEYKFSGGSGKGKNKDWQEIDPDEIMEISEVGEWQLEIRVTHGNKSINGKIATAIIDLDRPMVSTVSKVNSMNGKSVTLEIEAEDEISIDELRYSFDRGVTWSKSKNKTFNKTTTLKIGDIQIKDEAGNIAYAPFAYQIDIGSNSSYKKIQAYYTKNNMGINSSAVYTGYIKGVGNGMFKPDDEISRAELATILSRVVNFTSSSTGYIIYGDVDKSHWAYDNIINTQRYNLLKTDEALFYPDKAVTRGELAHALCQFIDLDGINPTEHGLSDISKSEFQNDIIKLYTTGLMQGDETKKFRPEDTLTRAEVVTVINRIININDQALLSGQKFDDVPETHWAYKEILKASY